MNGFEPFGGSEVQLRTGLWGQNAKLLSSPSKATEPNRTKLNQPEQHIMQIMRSIMGRMPGIIRTMLARRADQAPLKQHIMRIMQGVMQRLRGIIRTMLARRAHLAPLKQRIMRRMRGTLRTMHYARNARHLRERKNLIKTKTHTQKKRKENTHTRTQQKVCLPSKPGIPQTTHYANNEC